MYFIVLIRVKKNKYKFFITRNSTKFYNHLYRWVGARRLKIESLELRPPGVTVQGA